MKRSSSTYSGLGQSRLTFIPYFVAIITTELATAMLRGCGFHVQVRHNFFPFSWPILSWSVIASASSWQG